MVSLVRASLRTRATKTNGVGNTVGLAVVRHGLDRLVGELGLGFAQVDGGDDTVDERGLSCAITIRSGPLPVAPGW